MFTRVDPKAAGPHALGILIPPGQKTLVVLRLRALQWDLLPAKWDGAIDRPPQFCLFTRDESAALARRMVAFLEAAVDSGACPVETFGTSDETSVQIWLRACDLVWITCVRQPGDGYRPMMFTSRQEATAEAERIADIVWPAPDAVQEYYFNTQAFS